MSVSSQPFTDAALARHYYRGLPASWREEVSEADYVPAALAVAKLRPAEAAFNDHTERRAIRRERDSAFDAAERRRERVSSRSIRRKMRLVAIRRQHERRMSQDGRSLIFISSGPTGVPSAPGTRSRERRRGDRRRTVRTSGSSSDDPGGDPDSDDDGESDPSLSARLSRALSRSRGPPAGRWTAERPPKRALRTSTNERSGVSMNHQDGNHNGNGNGYGSSDLRRTLELEMHASGRAAKDLTVLAAIRDPFRLDTPAGHRDARWLADLIDRLDLGERRIHLRGLHYAIVSAEVTKPDGKPYRNTEDDWNWLVEHPAKKARWLGFVPFDQIIDARNAEPVIVEHSKQAPEHFITVGVELDIPEAEDLEPRVNVEGFVGRQPYRLVIYGEKTSLEDVLRSVARSRKADLYLPSGEISDTLLYRMAEQGAIDGRKMIVFTFSDCDPAGWQMSISIGRKLQAFRAGLFPELKFEVRRVALDPDQVREYGLPSTPLKAKELRAGPWRAATGVQQTEIDSLAALRPKLLERIARDALAPFYDTTLDRRVADARQDYLDRAQTVLEAEIDSTDLAALRIEAAEKLETLREQIDALNEAMHLQTPDIELPEIAVPPPEVERVGGTDTPLIDSEDDWAAQTGGLIASKAYRR